MSGHWQMRGHVWALEYTDGPLEGMLRGIGGVPSLLPTKKEAAESSQRWGIQLQCRIVKVRVSYTEIKK
mgnify:CR=1 FL=1